MPIELEDLEEVNWRQDGGVVTLSLNRPEKRNAITMRMLGELIYALQCCEDSDAIRAVVIRGVGKGFCPGDDLGGMGALPETYLDALRHPATHAALQACLRALPKPTIAAIHGFAFGVGLDLAMACDFRIAAADAQLRDQRVFGRGMHAVTGCAWFQPRALGLTKALEFLILGQPYTGTRAADVGMVTKAVPASEFESSVHEFATKLANAPTKAIGLMKKQIYEGLNMTHDEFMAFAAPLIREVEIKDRQEGISAFLEKRPAKFTGQ
ncbi:MAG: enoyl-CoA hydratase/isomerase family protein [Pseudomonadales bacterium]|jgi:2-(1,2-epoxy-1,2-dihydrophenyl)acetyl-CoA isomerase|nr:enoyl-CoA hydratase/isomerase family protein [Pseudomonadales bacterium]MDP7144218.1 enoyl-CoA hydratase/isomerase family protein [Pseudomonadales bacterium]MDP7358849.1 enoyl-CoA hydratase/isomerase family protein [Pseudomonadales bacterium]MDP7594371.1 enoyl-CoA hydratase/isomerase family protein [Pseudomonadales bacterium]HJN49074.1 enoyl-CoA hydratase/isomerase family protein [Pseudomonadales bacterium]|tara:strand:+ start:15 stop:815 length:801 start_codon:yes stop_codon:yes gene_type:complete